MLIEPIGCMFLAGEATHETLWGTVDGAWESGERAADAALRRIGAIKDNAPVAAPARARTAASGGAGAHRVSVVIAVQLTAQPARSTPSSTGRPKITATAIRA